MILDRILVIGRDNLLAELSRPYAGEIFAADDKDDINDIVRRTYPDSILFDMKIPQQRICDLLNELRERDIDVPVIAVSDKRAIPNEDQLKAMGVFGFIRGTTEHNKIEEIFHDIKFIQCDFDREKFFLNDCPRSVSIVGKSPAATKMLKMVNIVAKSSCNPILITGETGTGKELAARAVHILRRGSEKKFVAVNCAALTANLLESELFGHVKGSFTSADKEKTGLLEYAEDGTVFLDEISEMPPELQAKLLRVLQEHTFRKVGGTKKITCKATIIASSNRNLLREVEQNKFRRDLYYRLAICPINLTPLRMTSRRDDITLLAEYFIKSSSICPEKKGRIKGLTAMAADALMKHHWPGNIRELKNVIDRAVLLENSEKIGLSNLIINPDDFENAGDNTENTSTKLKDYSLERAEKELIAKALDEAGWQKTRAAALLGITRATLYAKVKQYDIKEPQKQEAVTV